MAEDQVLRMGAEVVDRATGPLKAIQNQLRQFERTPQIKAFRTEFDLLQKSMAKVGSIAGVGASLTGVGLAALGAGGGITALAESFRQLATRAIDLKFLSQETAISTQRLRELEYVGKQLHIAPEAVQSGVAAFAEQMKLLRRHRGQLSEFFAGSHDPNAVQFGESLAHVTDNAEALGRALAFLDRIKDPMERRWFLEAAGLPREFDRLPGMGGRKLFEEARRELAKEPPGLAEQAEKYEQAISRFEQAIDRFKNDVAPGFLKAASGIVDYATTVIESFDSDKSLLGRLRRWWSGKESSAGTDAGPASKNEESTEKGTRKGILQGLRDYLIQRQSFVPGAGTGGSGAGAEGEGGPVRYGVGRNAMYGARQAAPAIKSSLEGTAAADIYPGGGVIDRSRFAKELENNPDLLDKVLAISAGENNDPNANISVIETMMNRAAMTGTSLAFQARTTGEGGYYAGYNPGALRDPKRRAILEDHLRRVLAGSNVSNYATDNASQWLASKEAAEGSFTVQSRYGGETFFSPGWRNAGRGRDRAHYDAWRKAIEGGTLQHYTTDDIQRALGARQRSGFLNLMPMQEHKVTGDASLSIDLNGLPRGSRTRLAFDGLFREVKLNRGRQMPFASEDA